jgi:ABC-type amino acid transport substrate-binding protein
MSYPSKSASVRRLLATSVALAAAIALAACSSPAPDAGDNSTAPPFKTATPGVLTVGSYASYPPIIIVEPDKTLTGFLGELIDGFAGEYGLKIELMETTFPSVLLGVQQGRADMGYDIFYTEERAKTMYYTTSIYNSPVVAFTLGDFKYTGPNSLKGKRVATDVGLVWTPYLQEMFGDGLQLFQTNSDAMNALLNGQIDAYINGAGVLFNEPFLSNQDKVTAHEVNSGDFGFPDDIINSISYNIVGCDNVELATAFDKYVNAQRDNGGWDELLDKYKLPDNFRIDTSEPPAEGCGN